MGTLFEIAREKTQNRAVAAAAAASVQPDAPRKGIKALLPRYPLVFYFIIAYAFSLGCP